MSNPARWTTLAGQWLGRGLEHLTPAERHIIERFAHHQTVSRDISKDFAREGGVGGTIADKLTGWAGSWTFIILFLVFLAVWTVINTVVLTTDAVDPYPFVFLNLILSMLAAIQAPVIMMSQNRQAERDRIDARHDYEVNLKAELEIMALHEKLEAMRIQELDQIRQAVEAIARRLDADGPAAG